jgi:elongation factor 1-beta
VVSLPSGGVSLADDFRIGTLALIVDSRDHNQIWRGNVLARVVMTLRIMPEDVEVDLDDLLEKIKNVIPEGTDIGATETQPVAFGLKALRMNLARDESMGGTDDIEEAIGTIEGVSQVEVERVSRM